MKAMAEYFRLAEDTNVLDVGGGMLNWNFLAVRPRVTIINIGKRSKNLSKYVSYVRADARHLPFDSNAFDFVYSNSVIEPIGTLEDQTKMTQEVRRVGRSYYVQTPNFWFPVEPHLITPFFHWLPKPLRKVLIRNFTIWGWITRPTRDYCDNFVKMTRLLTKSEMRALFPDGQLQPEIFLGLEKSLIAVCRDSQQAP